MSGVSAETVIIIFRINSACSVIGSGCVCFLFFKLRWWKYSTHHIILFSISVADIIYSTALFVGPSVPASSKWCQIQGWTIYAFGLASQIWCAILGLNLWLQMRYFWKDNKCRKMMLWYHVFAWGVSLIISAIPACQGIMKQYGGGCIIDVEETWLIIWTSYIPIWFVFVFNWFIITKIVLILYRIMASIPQDMDNASKIKRHYKFVACQTIMFIFAGLLCWGIYLFSFKWWNLPLGLFLLHVTLNPLQGLVNLLVYVAPSWLHKCCFKSGINEETTAIEEDPFSKMEKNIRAVETVMAKGKTGADDIESDEDEESSTIGSLVWTDFRLASEHMSFYEGYGQNAIHIVQRRLSLSTVHLEERTPGGGRSECGESPSLVQIPKTLIEEDFQGETQTELHILPNKLENLD